MRLSQRDRIDCLSQLFAGILAIVYLSVITPRDTRLLPFQGNIPAKCDHLARCGGASKTHIRLNRRHRFGIGNSELRVFSALVDLDCGMSRPQQSAMTAGLFGSYPGTGEQPSDCTIRLSGLLRLVVPEGSKPHVTLPPGGGDWLRHLWWLRRRWRDTRHRPRRRREV
jgi:hypothetical protein